METTTIRAEEKLPVWIWHQEREQRPKCVLTRAFTAEQEIRQVSLHASFTGGARVVLDGQVVAEIEERAGNAGAFMKIVDFPDVLPPGEHELRFEMDCTAFIPLVEVNYYLWNRRVGAIAFLHGEGLWVTTEEENWQADESAAAQICLLGEEPFGDLENSPPAFVAGGFGDIAAYDLNEVVVQDQFAIEAEVAGDGKVRLSGAHGQDGLAVKPEQEQLDLFYHLRKQNEWKAMRQQQMEMDLSGASSVTVDLLAEHNCRFTVSNHGAETVKLLWNGAESLMELEHYEGCITEWLVVAPGETVCTLPQGCRYIQLYVLGEPGQSFELELMFQTVHVALRQAGKLQSDNAELNQIFEVSAHTSRICHQIGLWDGIKRDRLNWTFDFYLAAKSCYFLWDDTKVTRRAVRELGEGTPSGHWMNSICEYTLWWMKTVTEYYFQTGDKEFVLELKEPLQRHIKWVLANTRPGEGLLIQDGILIEWVPLTNEEKVIALQAIYALTHADLVKLAAELPELELAPLLDWPMRKLTSEDYMKDSYALAVKVLGIASGYVSAEAAEAFLDEYELMDPITPLSAFQLAECYSRYGKHERAYEVISIVWGGMLDHGATTFWEAYSHGDGGGRDFHDALTTYTAYGSYRMSLCHAWSSTPVKWIGEVVLGVQSLEPGYKTVMVSPNPVGGIRSCSGTVNTPHGDLDVKWYVDDNGKVCTSVIAPPGVQVVELSENKVI
ncbi:alpha-L-rhamnosidase C-terminal domain-containing protein [Paenibacillus lignilyticus]|uniref:Alpha-L-rhamnosidase n=1 Tax=Paenibacillus lignilyticus TaxID=1172615 RepID=A0ABS5CKU8_9BACL|nr:alpha-L-rhamnosidase C-terminal domain-containing protein [Paenibacillus lignilyticus]MBP3966495.1 alpha-L-rhamnosidase [Paenibacillus lignilyticus]